MAERAKVCVIRTGGLITQAGRKEGNSYVKLPGQLDPREVAPYINQMADISVVEADHIGRGMASYLVRPNPYVSLAETVYEQLLSHDGVVVTIDREQVQLLAPAVALALGSGLKKPVIFASSNQGPYVEHGDAHFTMMRGVLAASTDLAEVAVLSADSLVRATSFKALDIGGNIKFLPRSTRHELASIVGDVDMHPLARRAGQVREDINFRPYFSTKVAGVEIVPGTTTDNITSIGRLAEGIILYTTNQDTIPDEKAGPRYSLISAVRELTENRVPVLIASRIARESDGIFEYSGGKTAKENGAIIAGPINAEVATIKFLWVLGGINQEILQGTCSPEARVDRARDLMAQTFVGERGLINRFTSH